MKWVKQRAVTLQKRRQQELALQERGEAVQQGLYAHYQTEVYTPPPIEDVSGRLSSELMFRGSYRKTRSEISISMLLPCSLLVPSTCLVS